jgi:hypothetical protein
MRSAVTAAGGHKMKPIIFSTPMVKAILEGRKTQTRRVINPQPDKDDPCIAFSTIEGFQTTPEQAEEIWAQDEQGQSIQLKPRYKKGDVLWVKEKFHRYENIHGGYSVAYYADCQSVRVNGKKWTSPIFMPREAARLFLKVKSVRVERLQDISEADAISEGMKEGNCWSENNCYPDSPEHCESERHKCSYKNLWDSLNAKRGYSWESNPWVWVYV